MGSFWYQRKIFHIVKNGGAWGFKYMEISSKIFSFKNFKFLRTCWFQKFEMLPLLYSFREISALLSTQFAIEKLSWSSLNLLELFMNWNLINDQFLPSCTKTIFNSILLEYIRVKANNVVVWAWNGRLYLSYGNLIVFLIFCD